MPVLAERKTRSRAHIVPREIVSPTELVLATTRRVLVVDSCTDTVESTALLLGLWGHDVCGAGSGSEALAVVRACRPDVILMEIQLPGMNGYEVAQRLRQQRVSPEVLLVAVTGYGDERSRRRCLEEGFDLHLVKPVDFEVLQALLAASLRDMGGS